MNFISSDYTEQETYEYKYDTKEINDINSGSIISPTKYNDETELMSSAISPLFGLNEDKVFEMLVKKSVDEQRSNMKFKICVFILLILSVLIPTQFLITYPSCTITDGLCVPQLTFQIKEDSPEAGEILAGAREGLKLLSYLAKDLSINLNNNRNLFSTIDYVDVIDTFSSHNIYELNFRGYCRYNLNSGHHFCSKCEGLDIFSILVRDSGLQLGEISNSKKPSLLGDSFVTAYEHALSNIENSYQLNDEDDANKDKNQMIDYMIEIVHKAITLKKFSWYLSVFSFAIIVLSCISIVLIALIFISFFEMRSKFFYKIQRKLFMNFLIVISLSFVVLVLTFVIAASEAEYISLLNKFSGDMHVAIVNRGTGHYLVWSSVTLSLISCLIIIVAFTSCWIK